MNPAGVIITYIDWSKWKKWFFNIPLFLFQLVFMIVGKIIGKIKVEHDDPKYCPTWFDWCNCRLSWRRVWRAAQASHVRLCLKKAEATLDTWQYINFGYPKAKLDYWHLDQCDGKRFEYRKPMFNSTPLFIEQIVRYAYDQEGKGYDDLQLLSNGLHLIAWIVYPPCWGKELKIIKAFNRKGGREQCISGVTACLRWGEKIEEQHLNAGCIKRAIITKFIPGYSTATTFPCLVPLSKNWEEVAQ